MIECCTFRLSSSEERAHSATDLPSFEMRPGVACPDWSAVTSPAVKDALVTLLGSEHIAGRWRGYEPAEDRVRVALLRLYATLGRAPTLEELAKRTGFSETAVPPLLEKLRRRDLIVIDADDRRVIGAYPFTDRDTGHRVKLDGRSINAMCAVDALGVGGMLGRDIEIDSLCRTCGAPIWIATREEGRTLDNARPETTVAWLGLRYEGGCAANSLCTVTTFFCTEDHLAAWRKEHSDERGVQLSGAEALEIGRAIFGPSLAVADALKPSLR